jgi:2-polyprenyl-6-methoxyphenol hydroxylase-like FAD-dependent oxidoreductase
MIISSSQVMSYHHHSHLVAKDFSSAKIEELLAAAIGKAACQQHKLSVHVHSVRNWTMHAQVAKRFQGSGHDSRERGRDRDRDSDRVFLAGDSAHRFPPSGGFGMNTGLQDAHNIAWKLALVLRGRADPRLVTKTYEAGNLGTHAV